MGGDDTVKARGRIVRSIEWIGTHPFATGVLAILGVAGFIFSIYTFAADQADTAASAAQAEQVQGSVSTLSEDSARRETGIQHSVEAMAGETAARDETMRASLDRIERRTMTSLQDRVPVVVEMIYPEARRQLIAKGWIPRNTRWQDLEASGAGTVAWALWNAGYQEVEDCAGTGTAPCRFNFVDTAGNQLAVVTEGETLEDIDYDERIFVRKPSLEDLIVTKLWLNREEL